MVAANASYLESENAKLRKELETLSTTHAKAKAGLAKDLGETHDDFEEKTRECDALRAKVSQLQIELATLRDVSRGNDVKIQGLQSHVALDVMDIAHLATLVRCQSSNCLRVTAEHGEL